MGVTKDTEKLTIFKVQNLYFKGTKYLFSGADVIL